MDLTLSDLVTLLQIKQETILSWVHDGTLPSYRLGGNLLFNREEIEKWLLSHQKTPFKHSDGGFLHYSLFRALHKGGVIQDIEATQKKEVLKASMKVISK